MEEFNFSGVNFKKKIVSSYWDNQENRVKFLNSISKKFNIQKASDWGNITVKQVCQIVRLRNRFKQLVEQLYFGNLTEELEKCSKMHFQVACITSIMTLDIPFDSKWFYREHKYPSGYWNSFDNCKRFFDQLEIGRNESEFKKISISFISKQGGQVKPNFYL